MTPSAGREAVLERHGELDGLPVRWLEAAPADAGAPILWVHGVPDSADMWRPFLERLGGLAVDLPGFGRSGKPAGWPYGVDGYAAFLERFLDARGIDRVRVVAHDWGAPALLLGDRIVRAVAIDVLPLLPGFAWHRIARLWRTPVAGEVAMGLTTGWALRRSARLPAAAVGEVLRHFDHGTQRAILRLYRGAEPDALARAGERLRDLRAPALVVWGADDPHLDPAWAQQLAAALPDARVRLVTDAGHWPWADRPELIGEIAAFLRG
jgi:pimeloyl-ACP methyl ester carboxylesterase